jgi:hypothetical protein
MVSIPLNDLWLPILGIIPIAYSIRQCLKKQKISSEQAIEFIVGFFIVLLSINDNINKGREHVAFNDKIKTLDSNISVLRDTIRASRDSLSRIGLKIDKTTGRIEVVDSQILKAVLRMQPPSTGVPDSLNFEIRINHDTLIIYPKEGSWSHGYVAFDTINSQCILDHMYMGMGPSRPVDKIVVDGKTYVTHVLVAFAISTHKGQPWGLKLCNQLNRYIIFGEDGDVSKRYIYKNGKVKWIPEIRR